MPDFELSIIQETHVSQWDYAEIKRAFSAALETYRNNVYTDEASAKADKSELNKIKKIIDDKRKEYKAHCLAPYEAVEPELKELINMIEKQRTEIDLSVKNFEEQHKIEKEAAVREYYNTKSAVLGELAEPLYKKLFSSKWLNASTTRKKYEEEIQLAISAAANDIAEIKSLHSPYIDSLLDSYATGLSLEDCIRKNEEFIAANNKAGISHTDSTPQAVVKHEIADNAGNTDGVTVKLCGSKSQLEQAFDFMKAIGVDYTII